MEVGVEGGWSLSLDATPTPVDNPFLPHHKHDDGEGVLGRGFLSSVLGEDDGAPKKCPPRAPRAANGDEGDAGKFRSRKDELAFGGRSKPPSSPPLSASTSMCLPPHLSFFLSHTGPDSDGAFMGVDLSIATVAPFCIDSIAVDTLAHVDSVLPDK